jgi:hypothetical protein
MGMLLTETGTMVPHDNKEPRERLSGAASDSKDFGGISHSMNKWQMREGEFSLFLLLRNIFSLFFTKICKST